MADDIELFGRRMILSDAEKITDKNLIAELTKAMGIHQSNSAAIDYLYRYYKGDQPILERTKEVRPEICNKIVANYASEIIDFKVGYQCGEPIQYVSVSDDEKVTQDISLLSRLMALEGKKAKDKELFQWMFIGGVGVRFVKPRNNPGIDDSPVEIYSLDPRNAFVVYSSDVSHKPLMGVKFRVIQKGNKSTTEYSVYTEDKIYTVRNDKIVRSDPHIYGTIPLIEYPANSARLGAFEIVLSLTDAVNTVESNRVDGIEQNIQAFLKFINCEIEEEQLEALHELGAIMIKSADGKNADVDSVNTDLDQTQTQVTKDDLRDMILTICSMPNRNGGSSTSDTGAAVEMRDGWSAAESWAKNVDAIFEISERQMLRFVLKILRDLSAGGKLGALTKGNPFDLMLIDMDIKSTRRNYSNIQSKSQVLVTMLECEKIHPLLAFTACGMFSDPESAYKMSEAYRKEREAEEAKRLDQMAGTQDDDVDV